MDVPAISLRYLCDISDVFVRYLCDRYLSPFWYNDKNNGKNEKLFKVQQNNYNLFNK